MKHSTPRLLLSAAALAQYVVSQQVPAIPGAGMDQVCMDDGLQTIIYEYPVFYSTVYESVGTIFNFLGGTNSLVINNPGQTIVTSTVLTTTVVTTSTTTATVTSPGGGIVATATLGAGIASGTITAIPSSSPFALAFIVDAVGGKRPKGFASDEGTGAAADADFFYLQDGELRSTAGGKVGRNSTQSYAKIVATEDDNDVTSTFTLVDGALRWDSADKGLATFYECPDGLYAGFPDAPFSNCTIAIIGAIAKFAVDAELGIGGSTTTGSSMSSTSTISRIVSSTSGTSSGTMGGSASSTSRSTTSGNSSGATTSQVGSSSSGTGITTSSRLSSSTTTSGSATTTSAGGDEGDSICPGADPEDDYFGYSVYCGQAIDPVDPNDELIPGGEKDVATFDDCTILCDSTEGCTGLSYFAAGSTCYIHGGENQEPRDAPGYDGAIKTNADDGGDDGDDGDDSSSTTSTTSRVASTTSGGAASTTSGGAGSSTTTSSGASTTSAATTSGASTTSAATTSSGASTTTTSPGTTTTSKADVCPTPTGSVSGGYEIYCGYVVDPVSGADDLGTGVGSVSFQQCLDLCTANVLCVGLSYIEASTTCYLHKNANKAPEAKAGWRGAIKVSAAGTSTTTSTTTTSGNAGASSTTTSSTTSTITSTSQAATTSTTTTTTSSTTTSSSATTTTAAAGGTSNNPADGVLVVAQCEANCPDAQSVIRNGYQIYAGTGVDGTGLPPYPRVNSFQECIDLCTSSTGCISVSWKRDTGDCYKHSDCHKNFSDNTNPPTFDSAERIASSCSRQS